MSKAQELRAGIIAALDTDTGVDERALGDLMASAEKLPDYGTTIFNEVEYEQGRYFLTSEQASRLRQSYGV